MKVAIILLVAFLASANGLPFRTVLDQLNKLNNLKKSRGRIVGGVETNIEEFPYQVSLDVYGDHVCGGAPLTPSVVITAAHCTDATEIFILLGLASVRAGTTNLASGGQLITITEYTAHPQHIWNELDYDVALLFLESPLILGPSVQTIQIQPVNQEIALGTIGFVTGWGALDEGGTVPEKLQVVQVPLVDNDFCNEANININPVTPRMICFGFDEGGKDACQGDSGGPLVVRGKLIGVVSWGDGCARPEKPGVYAKMADPEINAYIVSTLESLKEKEKYYKDTEVSRI